MNDDDDIEDDEIDSILLFLVVFFLFIPTFHAFFVNLNTLSLFLLRNDI
jgi:hypothetical protein